MSQFETGASNARVNDIVLTVINDGRGDQCGMSYAQRCKIIGQDFALVRFRAACQKYAPTANSKDVCEAAQLVHQYYIEHNKEA